MQSYTYLSMMWLERLAGWNTLPKLRRCAKFLQPRALQPLNISWIGLRRCEFHTASKPHVLVTKHYTKLQRVNATAISYTWGNDGRRPRSIGHDSQGNEAILELGDEWRVADLIEALHDIRHSSDIASGQTEPGYCWIDQLCISQQDIEDRGDLFARIPGIFRTFEVAVLLPGSRCECAVSRLRRLESTPPIDDDYLRQPCLNNVNFLTWTRRLWTRFCQAS